MKLFVVFLLFFFSPEKIWAYVNVVCRWNNTCFDLKALLHQNSKMLDSFVLSEAVTSGIPFNFGLLLLWMLTMVAALLWRYKAEADNI